MQDYKVVTAQEMARIEKLALNEGCSESFFIEEVGRKIAAVVLAWIEKKGLPKTVTLLVGKGNNGADAYAVGIHLIKRGVKVRAVSVCGEGSVQNKKFKELFLAAKGELEPFCEGFYFDALIVDGLVGIGFKGEMEEAMASLVDAANGSGRPIIAIDIPSGVNATTGVASNPSICAAVTVTLGLAKIGLFLRDAWCFIGQLQIEKFGLPEKYEKEAVSAAYLLNEKRLTLPSIVRNRHKYQAGYVVGLSGSEQFKGAPKLAGLAALRSGAGMVRIFHLGEIGPAPMELICEPWDLERWEAELKRAGALFFGPGLGNKAPLVDLQKIEIPSVVDADSLQPGLNFPKHSILTPHRGEMARLLELDHPLEEEEFLFRCQKFAETKNVTLLLKGAPTFIFSRNKNPLIVARGDPGMATAGSGDVLTGLLASLLAQKLSCYEAAALGAYLHAVAGELAAEEKTSYGMIAGDLIHLLPKTFRMQFDS